MKSIITAMVLAAAFAVYGQTSLKAFTMKPFLYTQDFESGNDPAEQWAVGAKYTVNERGITSEKARSGKNAYKIDVSFEDGRYLYFAIPISVPAKGKLKLSAYIFVPDMNTGEVGFGVNYAFPPTINSGCGPLCAPVSAGSGYGSTFKTTKGEWIYVEGNVITDGENRASIPAKYVWGINSDDRNAFGTMVDKLGFFLYGAKGKRVIMYIDDIKLEGEVPDAAEYLADVNERWSTIKAKHTKRISAWGSVIGALQNDIASAEAMGDAVQIKNDASVSVAALTASLAAVKKKPYIERVDQTAIDTGIKALRGAKASIETVSAGKASFSKLKLYAVSPVSDIKILPFDAMIPGAISDTLRIMAAPGEFEPASFVVKATADIGALTVSVSDLAGEGSIPASAVNVKLVKCWYQAGTAWDGISQNKMQRVLVPELLLNDDALIKVDHAKKDDYIRGDFSDGERYLWISEPKDIPYDGRNYSSTLEELPVRDAASLRPVAVNAGTNQQFWVTVRVPENAAPGVYTGTMTLSDGGTILGTITLKVKVLPFTLSAPYYTSSIYYRGILDRAWGSGSIGSEFKSEKQLAAELRNMLEHGVDNPTVYQPEKDKELVKRYLSIFREAGWTNTALYYLGNTISMYGLKDEGIARFIASSRDIASLAKQYGIDTLYVYGLDEATGDRLASQRKAFQEAHTAGVKLFVAGSRGTYEAVGDLLDVYVHAYDPSESESSKWHTKGHKIWSYANPQGGVENPLVYRRNFGLLLWKNKFDGACTYAYQHGMGYVWNDLDHLTYRDHNFTYPTADGVIDTIAWEGYREAVDDIRYLTTLEKAIVRAKAAGKDVSAASEFLKAIDVENDDLDDVRAQMIRHIISLGN